MLDVEILDYEIGKLQKKSIYHVLMILFAHTVDSQLFTLIRNKNALVMIKFIQLKQIYLPDSLSCCI